MFQFHSAGGRGPRYVWILGSAERAAEAVEVMRVKFLILGSLLALLGVLGFLIPSPLFGLIETNAGLNIAHILSGAFAITAAFRGIGSMRMCGRILGFAYLALAIVGFAAADYDAFAYVALEGAANWLHLGVAAVFLYFALLAHPTP